LRRLSLFLLLGLTAGQYLFLAEGKVSAVVLAVSLGIWWQAFSLTRPGHRFATILDTLMERR